MTDTIAPKIKHTITVAKYETDDTSGEPIETITIETEHDAAEWPLILAVANADHDKEQ